jgi:hypothetical protein
VKDTVIKTDLYLFGFIDKNPPLSIPTVKPPLLSGGYKV